MASCVIFALGLMILLEGLVFALAPSFLEELLKALQHMSPKARQQFGLTACALGVCLLAISAMLV